MPINLPRFKAPPSELADWIELRTLASTNGMYRFNRLKRYWDTHRETEDSDPEGRRGPEEITDEDGVSGVDDDAFFDSITDQLNDRANALGTAYPFEVCDTRFQLKQPPWNNGQHAYLFCLILTNSKPGEILNESWHPEITHTVRDLFQACSTLAAAAEVNGCAISFGWPRPNDNPAFLKKIAEVYAAMGEGKPVKSPKPGASPSVKDEEIDIIAWRPRPDGAAGTHYLLGQVASGANWEAKSIKGNPIDYFHRTWFDEAPASEPRSSIFIPHAVVPVGAGNRRDAIDVMTTRYGSIFDRLLLPTRLDEGIALANQQRPDLLIERRDDFPRVVEWVGTQISSLRAAGEGPL